MVRFLDWENEHSHFDSSTAVNDFDPIGNSANTFHPLSRYLGDLLLVIRGDTAPEDDNAALDFNLNVTQGGITGVAQGPLDRFDRDAV
jgi:hypothetical protein